MGHVCHVIVGGGIDKKKGRESVGSEKGQRGSRPRIGQSSGNKAGNRVSHLHWA